MSRKKIPPEIENRVLVSSKRRCPICYFIDEFRGEVQGQIAHLNKNRDDNSLNNLAFMCLRHHSIFDSKNSQHKNYTAKEIAHYRDLLTHRFEEFPKMQIIKEKLNKEYCLNLPMTKWVECASEGLMSNHALFEISYRIVDDHYAGYLFCISSESGDNKIYGVISPKEGEEILEQVFVYYVGDDQSRKLLASFPYSKDWSNLEIKIEKDIVIICHNGMKVYSYENIMHFPISKITIGGAEESKGSLVDLSFTTAILADHSIRKVIYKMDFSHGRQYFEDSKSSEKMIFYNVISHNFNSEVYGS